LITFWTTRVGAIFEAYYLSELLLSGRVFPLVLTPHWFQTLTWYFPFRWSFAFPIVALTGPITNRVMPAIVHALGHARAIVDSTYRIPAAAHAPALHAVPAAHAPHRRHCRRA
jgi:hypothetical protein